MANSSGFALLHKKASLVGAFFVGVVCSFPALAFCPPAGKVQVFAVRQVVDGDTLRLADGRSVRLIGINAPEIARQGRVGEPYADAAKRRLQALVDANEGRVGLRRGTQSTDRYGRILAYAYGRNGHNLQAQLLSEGLGYYIAVPPNVRFASCEAAAEQAARKARRGLWQGSPTIRARAVKHSGFALVSGRVTRVQRSNGAASVEIDGVLQVRLPARLLRTLPKGFVDNLKGRTLEVRGWIIDRSRHAGWKPGQRRWMLPVTHAHMLQRTSG